MIEVQATLPHHFLKISITQCIAQIPPHAQENDVCLEMTPFQRILTAHEKEPLSLFFTYSSRSVLFPTHPWNEHLKMYKVELWSSAIIHMGFDAMAIGCSTRRWRKGSRDYWSQFVGADGRRP